MPLRQPIRNSWLRRIPRRGFENGPRSDTVGMNYWTHPGTLLTWISCLQISSCLAIQGLHIQKYVCKPLQGKGHDDLFLRVFRKPWWYIKNNLILTNPFALHIRKHLGMTNCNTTPTLQGKGHDDLHEGFQISENQLLYKLRIFTKPVILTWCLQKPTFEIDIIIPLDAVFRIAGWGFACDRQIGKNDLGPHFVSAVGLIGLLARRAKWATEHGEAINTSTAGNIEDLACLHAIHHLNYGPKQKEQIHPCRQPPIWKCKFSEIHLQLSFARCFPQKSLGN